MDRQKLTQDLEDILLTLKEAQDQATTANRRVAYLNRMAESIRGLLSLDAEAAEPELPGPRTPLPVVTEDTPAAAPTDDDSSQAVFESAGPAVGPSPSNGSATVIRPREAILQLLAEQPRLWRLGEIVQTMNDRGWLDRDLRSPLEATRAAANRLVDVDKKLERVGKSSYRFPTQGGGT